MARRKKKNYRLRKSVRRTLGALFMISAIIVAAIPFPDAAATNGVMPIDDDSTTKKAYEYKQITGHDALAGTEGYVADEMIDLSGKNAKPGSKDSKALIVRQNSNGDYVLYKQLDFFEQDFTGNNISGTYGVVTEYNSVYQAGTIKLPSSVYKEYYTVDPGTYTAFFSTAPTSADTLESLSKGGDVVLTLDLQKDFIVKIFQEFRLSDYEDYIQSMETYKAAYAKYEEELNKYNNLTDKTNVSQPIAPTVPTAPSFNPKSLEDKDRYYCYVQPDLAGRGYRLEYVNDKSADNATSDDKFIYIARGGEAPANMKNDDFGFLVKKTASIIAVGDGTFKGVKNVDYLTLPSEIKYIGESAFEGSFIKEVYLEGTESIGHFAFKNCTQLNKVVLGPVSNIGIEAFHGCVALTSINFPYQVSKIGYGAFAECTKLSDVNLSEAKTSGLTVGNGAFYNCALGNLTLGETGIQSLGDGAFASTSQGTDQLTEVNMESSKIKEFGENVFFGRYKLLKVIMPAVFGVNSEDTLPNTTFQGCSGLGMIEFPKVSGKVTFAPDIFSSVMNDQFVVKGPALDIDYATATERMDTRECNNGVVIDTDENGKPIFGPVPYMYEENVEVFYEVKSGSYLLSLKIDTANRTASVVKCDFVDGVTSTSGELLIPKNVGPYKVIKLENDCFSDPVKDSLENVNIQDNSIQEIGDSVFQGCTGIESVKIGNSVTSIGSSAFQGCTTLHTLTIGSGVTTIKDNAFQGCHSLQNITFEAPAGGAASFPRENIGANALSTGSTKLTVTGILEQGYGPFEWAMDENNFVDPNLGIRVCYKTPAPQSLTVILDNQNNLPTLVDYPHYGDLDKVIINVNTNDSTTTPDAGGGNTGGGEDTGDGGDDANDPAGQAATYNTRATTQTTLLKQYESDGELSPSEEALVKATLYIDIPAGIESIDVKGYLTDSSKNPNGIEPKTNGYNVNAYFNDSPYKSTYERYGLFNGLSNDDVAYENNKTETKDIGNDRIRSITMHTVKYLPNSDATDADDNVSREGLAGGAFYSCENLETVALGSAMEDIGELPFLGCYNLTSVSCENPKYTCENKIIYETKEDGTLGIAQALGSRGNANDGTVTIDNDAKFAEITSIAKGAFSDLPNLRRVDFTGTNKLLTELPDYCFYNDGKISQVILSPEMRTIGQKSLAECADNVSLTIYGREVSLATDTFDGTEGAVVYAYRNTAAFNTADKIADIYNNVEVLPLDETYKVQFFDYDGITALTDVQYIEKGKNAEPPEEEPKRQGYIFTGWNKPYKDIMEDTTIIALYDIDPDSVGGDGTGGNGGNTGGAGGAGPNGGNNVNGGIDLDGDGIPDVDANGNKLYKLTVTNGEGSGYYPAGKTVTIKAGNAPKGATFAYWNCSNDDLIFEDSTKWITTLTMIASDVTVIANYTGQYVLEVEYGSGSGSYPAGAKVAISAVGAPQGRKFASWISKTTGLTIENSKKESTIITMPAQNAKVTATYMDTGSISGNSTKPSQNGTTIMITKPGISDKDKASAYVTGSSDNFIVKISESLEAADEVQKALQKKYPDMSRIKYFAMDISLYDAKGVNKITNTSGLKVNITMPIPDALKEYAGNNRVGAVVDGTLESLNPKFTTIDGVPSISFTATHFSPYTIYVDTGNMTVTNTPDSTPKTGDGIHPKWFLSIGLACISIILFTKRDRRYTTKAYR